MCGIGGVQRYGDTPINVNQIVTLGCALERRGNHATGVAVMSGSDIHILKAPKPAWEFFVSKDWEDFCEEHFTDAVDIVLVHTRLATQGDPSKNANNHPLSAGKAAIIHNGGVMNDSHLFNSMSLKRAAETDSDIIRAIADEHGITPKAVEEMNRMTGGVAAAVIHPDFPGRLMLLRSGSPMVLGWDDEQRQLFFASEKNYLHTMSRMPVERIGTLFQGNRSPLYFQTVMPDTAYIYEQGKGQIFHGNFRSANYYSAPVYRVHENYERSMKRWPTKELPAMTPDPIIREMIGHQPTKVVCRNPRCSQTCTIPEALRGKPLWELHCKRCETMLMEEPAKA